MLLLIGDMNAKAESHQGVMNAKSSNGKLLIEMVKNEELEVLNWDERCRGKWTHVIRTTEASSVLDYALVCRDLAKCIKEVIIDEECLFCPFGIRRKNGVATPQYSDHNAMIITHSQRRKYLDK